jgi:winged helix-turn-helix DNA-binding protein/FCS type zinc finger protein
MARPKSATLTELDRRILAELRTNARLSFRTLATRLGVSTPTVSKRVQRMERAGIIQGYTVLTPDIPAPPTGPRAELSCAHCKNPIEGPPRLRQVGDETKVFCCENCANSYVEKLARPSQRPGASVFVVVVLAPAFSFGLLLFVCSPGACVTAMPIHCELGACAPLADRTILGPMADPMDAAAAYRRFDSRGPRFLATSRRRASFDRRLPREPRATHGYRRQKAHEGRP